MFVSPAPLHVPVRYSLVAQPPAVVQVAQMRLVDVVGCATMYCVAAHVVTVLHVVWPVKSWYVVVPSHAVHTRSAAAVGALVWRVPAAQGALHARHDTWLPRFWYVPVGHARQTRLLVAVGAVDWNVPTAHVAETALHAARLGTSP